MMGMICKNFKRIEPPKFPIKESVGKLVFQKSVFPIKLSNISKPKITISIMLYLSKERKSFIIKHKKLVPLSKIIPIIIENWNGSHDGREPLECIKMISNNKDAIMSVINANMIFILILFFMINTPFKSLCSRKSIISIFRLLEA